MKKFSIIVPVYNVAQYLEKCVDSILEQNYHNYEVIFVDDGSTDDSGALCDNYSRQDSRFITIHKKNGGLSSARNAGARMATGDYIIFLDADDYLESRALENLDTSIGDFEYDLIVNRVTRVNNETLETMECPYELKKEMFCSQTVNEIYKNLLHLDNFVFAAWIFVVEREFLISNNLLFEEGLLHEDELWTSLLFVKARHVWYNNSDFYCYRISRPNSIMKQVNIKKAISLLTIIERLNAVNHGQINRELLLMKMANIYLSLMYTASDYKNADGYESVIAGMKKYSYLLMFSESLKGRIIYWAVKIFGLKSVIEVVNIYKKILK